jgi:NodT family efflux transporter outer membrane factor (OMF) lipoprotein
MKYVSVIGAALVISGCSVSTNHYVEPKLASQWGAFSTQGQAVQQVNASALKNWWLHFNDPTLNQLIDNMLSNSPDRNIAQARIAEARGTRRSTSANLLPQIGASASAGRADTGIAGPENISDPGFDASFEIDVFGRNRKNLNAADAQLLALEYQYHDTTLSLIAEISRTYIDYRGFAKQTLIAEKNLSAQQRTLDLIHSQKKLGAATQLDVERAENLVNTTTSSIPEFQRLADNARLRLSILTGDLPETLLPILLPTSSTSVNIPGSDVKPLLLSPADVLTLRPDVKAASANLASNTSLVQASIAELWPKFTLSGFFGTSETVLSSANKVWNVALGTAVNLIDFGRIEGRIDAAKARERMAYEQYRKAILSAVNDVETALNDYTYIDQQRVSLKKAYNNADRALNFSQNLYREGEISFLDVLDAQRTVNAADSALVNSEVTQAESLIRLYKSLGVY